MQLKDHKLKLDINLSNKLVMTSLTLLTTTFMSHYKFHQIKEIVLPAMFRMKKMKWMSTIARAALALVLILLKPACIKSTKQDKIGVN